MTFRARVDNAGIYGPRTSRTRVFGFSQIVVSTLIALAASGHATKALSNDSEGGVPNSGSQSVSQEQIETANRLHQEATSLFKSNQFEQAVEKESEAKNLAPGYWLPHAALSYFYFGRGGPAVSEAAEAIQTNHPWLADMNLGLILQYFQLYDESIKAFKRVPSTAHEFPLAKVGIATALIEQQKTAEGRKLVDQACAAAPNDAVLLEAIANAYGQLGDLNRAKQICERALSISQDRKVSQRLRKMLIIVAARTTDLNLFDSIKENVSAELHPYERGWLKSEEFKFASSKAEGLRVLRFAESDNGTTNADWLSFALILQQRAASAGSDSAWAGWLELEQECLKHVEASEPNNVEVRIILASIEEQLGHKQAALQAVTEGWNAIAIEPSPTVIRANDARAKADVTGLAKAFVKEGQGYRSYVTEIECTMPKVTCHCRYNLFKQAVLGLPGIITVMIGPGDHPACLVLFDSRKTSKGSIFDSKSVVSLHEDLDVGQESHVKTLSQLGDLAARFVTPLHAPVFASEDVALQFPDPKSAQDNPVVSIGESRTGNAN